MAAAARNAVLLLVAIAAASLLHAGCAAKSGGGGSRDGPRGEGKESNRQKRFLSMFQIVTFENGVCEADDNRNGTCYTSEECDQRGGSSSGSCADGFGVCCSFLPKCGETTSEEVSYLSSGEDDDATDPGSCVYTICKSSPNICRIRLDFESFSIASPVLGTASTTSTTLGGAIGDCATDTFTLSSPGGVGSPVICGVNNGQHIIVDAGAQCSKAAFGIGSETNSRSWDIKVTQFPCGSEEGGPPGCLQYFTETEGVIESFNFDAPADGPVGPGVTHLSNQHYDICIRRGEGMGCICYTATQEGTPADANKQGSFGLSKTASSTDPKSAVGGDCSSDYIRIPGSFLSESPATDVGRHCGAYLDEVSEIAMAGQTICSQSPPFVVTFHTDADEVTTDTTGSNVNEMAGAPAGILGFRLSYVQSAACPA